MDLGKVTVFSGFAGFVYLGRFRRSACPSLRRIGAVTCQRKQADEISENAHVWRWRNA